VGDIPAPLQPKLLRVLQEQEFERLGSTHTHHVDVRLVAATNRDLTDMVKRAEFRIDSTASTFPFSCRRCGIARGHPALVTHFVERVARRMASSSTHPPDTMSALARRMAGQRPRAQNLVERAVILANHGVLPNPCCHPPPRASSPQWRRRWPRPSGLRRVLILNTLAAVGWVVGGSKGAAARLGMNRSTLIARMKKLESRVRRSQTTRIRRNRVRQPRVGAVTSYPRRHDIL
jgi:formate hydrogenlyase transcriptional activator